MKTLLTILFTVATHALCFCQTKKILIVSTNVSMLNNSANGTFLMEIAYPFAAFVEAGYEVDVLTPKGGKAALYHGNEFNESMAKIRDSKLFKTKTDSTLSPKEVDPKLYAGIYYPGGGGQFYDVVDNEAISSIAAHIYESGGVVGAAGHGPASLINIRLSDSEFLVKNKQITCYPRAWSAKWLPFDWEATLKQRGANVVLPTTDVEKNGGVQLLDEKNRMVSGSYAENAKWVAEQMILLINK